MLLSLTGVMRIERGKGRVGGVGEGGGGSKGGKRRRLLSVGSGMRGGVGGNGARGLWCDAGARLGNMPEALSLCQELVPGPGLLSAVNQLEIK